MNLRILTFAFGGIIEKRTTQTNSKYNFVDKILIDTASTAIISFIEFFRFVNDDLRMPE